MVIQICQLSQYSFRKGLIYSLDALETSDSSSWLLVSCCMVESKAILVEVYENVLRKAGVHTDWEDTCWINVNCMMTIILMKIMVLCHHIQYCV